MLLARCLHALFAFLGGLFHRHVRLPGGTLPSAGPALVVANHPNGLVDALVLARLTRRPLRWLAKEPLFRVPILGVLLRAAGSLPVYRARDGHATDKNADVLAAAIGALDRGSAVALFPEGTTHDAPSLLPLKTGAARLALGAAAAGGFARDVPIVPVGLVYEEKGVFRSEVATRIGPAVSVLDLQLEHARDPIAAARILTERIELALRDVTVDLDSWEDAPLLTLAEALTREGDDEPRERRIAFARVLRGLRERAEADEALRAELGRVRHRLAAMRERLMAVGLSPERVDLERPPRARRAFIVRQALAWLIGLPLALAAALVYLVPYRLVWFVARLARPEPAVLATIKLATGIIAFLPWQIGLSLLLGELAGGIGVALVWTALPLAGLYAVGFFTRRRRALAELVMLRQVVRPDWRPLVEALALEQAALRRDILALGRDADPA